MLNKYFKSIIDQTEEPIVICDLDFKILYMNSVAVENYHQDLTGKNLRDCHNADSNKKMEQIIENAHNTYMSYFEYNTENSLSCIVTLVYLYARSTYNVKREDVTAKGRADFTFYPLNINRPAFIIELGIQARR